MNAFTRQEIKAIAPNKPGDRWSAERARTSASVYQHQPVIDIRSHRVAAYHAVKRQWAKRSALPEIKRCIESSPAGRPLLLTLSLQNYVEVEHGQGNALLQLLQQYLWADRELIVHLEHHNDETWGPLEIYKRLQKSGIPTMVDAGASWDLPSINTLLDAQIIRFNAAQLPEALEQLLQLAKTLGVQTLLTDIRNKAQVAWARKLGFDWLQFNPARPSVI